MFRPVHRPEPGSSVRPLLACTSCRLAHTGCIVNAPPLERGLLLPCSRSTTLAVAGPAVHRSGQRASDPVPIARLRRSAPSARYGPLRASPWSGRCPRRRLCWPALRTRRDPRGARELFRQSCTLRRRRLVLRRRLKRRSGTATPMWAIAPAEQQSPWGSASRIPARQAATPAIDGFGSRQFPTDTNPSSASSGSPFHR